MEIRKYTIEDIAEIAGVSPRTVSRVVNNDINVKEETRKKVIRIINETGFQVNPIARSLRKNKTGILVVFVAENEALYMSQFHNIMIKQLNYEANRNGYKLIVSKSSPYEATENQNDGFYLLQNRFADGAVIFDTRESDPRLEYLIEGNIPFVIIGKDDAHKSSSYIDLNNFKAGYLGTEHLIKRGYKNIYFFLGGATFTANHDRAEGYRRACEDNGVVFTEESVHFNVTNPKEAYQRMKEILSSGDHPDAVFVSGDERAIGVYHAIQELGLSIPQDIAVLGIDNLPISEYYYPALSSISQPFSIMAREAIRIIDGYLKGSDKRVHRKIVEPDLVLREST